MRTTSPRLVVVAAAAFLLAAGGALAFLSAGGGSGSSGSGPARDEGASPRVLASDVWQVGDTWTVQVGQDSGNITPDGERSIANVAYTFRVELGPTATDEPWVVQVDQEGAQGPFADGWTLQYLVTDAAAGAASTLRLHRVALGDQEPMEAELAAIVLGTGFPYEVEYSAPPRDAVVPVSKLQARSALPPGELPQGGDAGVAPPALAPAAGGGQSAPVLPPR